ncbi:MAG: hypothetical protein AAGD01_16150 [Acidobacteriota bacterium]
MSSFPQSPKVTKGAIVGLDPFNPLASIVVFQYNPSELTRSVSHPTSKEREGLSDTPVGTLRLTRAPRENISANLILDAADQLESGSTIASTAGVAPQLAALQMLLYPKTALVIANTLLAKTGSLEIQPPMGPLTLFVYGLQRVVPVQIDSLSFQEELHGPDLMPIRARVSVSMTVLTYNNFTTSQPGYYLYLAHQAVQEAMATVGSIANLGDIAGGALL